MSKGNWGCFKIGCVGLALLFVISIGAMWAFFSSLDDNTKGVALPELGTSDRAASTPDEWDEPDATSSDVGPLAAAVGRVVLELAQGAFYVRAAEPGEETYVDADFDDSIYVLDETMETLAGGQWVHTFRFKRKGSGMFSLLQAIRSDDEPELHVYLSPDEPIELVVDAKQGGMEADLGGLWLTAAHIGFYQGGAEIEFSEPMRQPMDQLILTSRMGGLEVQDIAVASPRRMDARFTMGGAELDLDGEWAQDSNIYIDVYMGGAEVRIPNDVQVEGVSGQSSRRLRQRDPELPERVLTFDVNARMGEVEVSR